MLCVGQSLPLPSPHPLSCSFTFALQVKVQTLGVQLVLPVALLGGVLLIPINLSGDAVEDSGKGDSKSINPTHFMRLTVTNLPSGSPLLWVHFLCVILYTLYSCWLLKWHYRQFVVIRQHYMQRGNILSKKLMRRVQP